MHERDDRRYDDQPTPEEIIERELVDLAARLGFVESPALRAIREQCHFDMKPEEAHQAIAQYQNEARTIPLPSDSKEGPRAKLGLNIATALVINQTNLVEDAEDALDDIYTFAGSIGAQDVIDDLERILGKSSATS
jgi:hypothetical protein